MKFEAIKEVPLASLEIGPAQARVREVEKDLEELVTNIRIHGQLEPIVVARRPGGMHWPGRAVSASCCCRVDDPPHEQHRAVIGNFTSATKSTKTVRRRSR